jgi:membrane-bound lytic murein transglycosylase D
MQYRRYLRQWLPFLMVTVLGVLLSGCASQSGNTSLLNQPPVNSPEGIGPDSAMQAEPDEYAAGTTPVEESPVSVLVTEAKARCAAFDYTAADSISRMALLLVNGEQGAGDTVGGNDPIIDEIVALYVDQIPETIAPPDEISLQVFQQRMLRSFDSLRLSSEDSIYVAGLFNRSKSGYNVPVVLNSRVQRALFYYITRNKGTIDAWRARSLPYLSYMKKMFADSGLPDDLAYLPLIESGFNPKAYSRSHASGIWQFIPSTGQRYGLRSNYWLDERRDPVRATQAAIRYLKKLYNDFGHWHLALAAYNCGEGGLSRAIANRGIADYWQLKLPAETMNYVPLYLASLIIAKDPDFHQAPLCATVPFDTVTVSECIDLREIAAGIGASEDSLRRFNPHILRWCTPPDMSGVRLYLPPGSTGAFTAFVSSLPDEKKVRWYRYRIRTGDNLGSIARQFKIPVDGIKSVNRLRGTRIVAGHYMFIPIPVGAAGYAEPAGEPERASLPPQTAEVPENAVLTVYEVKPGDTVWRLAELFGVSPEQISGWNNLIENQIRAGQVLSIYTVPAMAGGAASASVQRPDVSTAGSTWYIVRAGDTAYRIAREAGMTLENLCLLNRLDPTMPRIVPGDSLRVIAGVSRSRQGNRIPADAIVYIVAPGDNLFRIAGNFSTTPDAIRSLNRLSTSANIHPGDTLLLPGAKAGRSGDPESAVKEIVYYKVKSGDNLWRIASDFGVPVERLCRDNHIATSAVLLPGDTLRVLREGEM